MKTPNVKGVAFRSVMASVETLSGVDAHERSLASMPREVGDALRYGKLVASGWYPIAWYRDMWAGVLRGTSGGAELVRKVGYECMRRDTAGVYRFVMRLLSPQTVFSASSRFYSTYYDTGSLTVTETRQGYAKAHWKGCEGFDRTMWIEVVASGEALVELAGGREVRHRIVSGGRDGDADAMTELWWT